MPKEDRIHGGGKPYTEELWITQTAAQLKLAIGQRTLQRMIKAGKIQVRREQRPGRSAETLCYLPDVERLTPAKPAPVFRDEEEATQQLAPANIQANPSQLIGLLTAIAGAIHETPTTAKIEPSSRRWITLQEAESRSGLSARFLKRAIREGSLKPAAKDGRTWKVATEALDTFQPGNSQNPDPKCI
jgi:hypothetical protein